MSQGLPAGIGCQHQYARARPSKGSPLSSCTRPPRCIHGIWSIQWNMGSTISVNGVNRMRKPMSLLGAVAWLSPFATEASAADLTGGIRAIDPVANAQG